MLFYQVRIANSIKYVTVYYQNTIFAELECLEHSPYSIEEEIQNYLDDNGFGDDEFEISRIN